ncbi:hypothetical protein MTQ89_09765 [Staphylococcus hyicus]|uniref:hypothetical protein n=1 Tax=Staphylococcus hyicus TaxID=1284 RepID=UPI00208F02B6|nr:hypothetical protein [Staphylococcus hyicus]MCO4329162.1 hypothetical protein [Staphylococcus hyicus]MCO4337023.1 hypothetical protein [Staphylococcus hyicus]UWF57200.1 hypothetical protein NZD48_02230 [Staphylococcus hyicus]
MSIHELIQKFMHYQWSVTDVILLMFFPSLLSTLFGPIIGIPAGIAFFIILFLVDESDGDDHNQYK